MVDQLGGLKDAIAYAADKAGIKEVKTLYYPFVKADPIAELLEQIGEDNETNIALPANQLPNAVLKYYEQLKALENIQGIQMRLPYEFIIQ